MESGGQDLSAVGLLSLAKYVMEVLSPSHKLVTHNLDEIMTAFKHDFRSKRTRLKCIPVPQQIVRSMTPNRTSSDTVMDIETCAVVGSKAAIKLGIPVGGTCWAFVSKCFCPVISEKNCGRRCQASGQVRSMYTIHLASNRNVPPYEILMNETMYHNVRTSLFGTSSPSERNVIVNINRCNHIVRERRFSPKYATKAVVSWIEQPQVTDDSVLSPCLSGFFQAPRHLHKGDLFRIQVSEYAPEVLLEPGMFGVQDIYLQVKSIEGPSYEKFRYVGEGIGYLIVKGETTLVQDINAQSFLPTTIFSRYSTLSSLLPNYPEGLSKVFNKFVDAVTPFLRSYSQGLKPSILVTGAAGSGKHFLVSSAAAQLGMHFWAVDCAEIRGSTSGQTIGKFKAVLSKAKQYAPCILLLSSIEILSRDQDGHDDFRVQDEFAEQLLALKSSKFPIVLVGAVALSTDLSGSFARMFLLELAIPTMEKEERKAQLKQFLSQHYTTTSEDCLEEIASRCSGFLLGDLAELVAVAIRRNLCDNLHQEVSIRNSGEKTTQLTSKNFGDALDIMQSAYAGCIGAPKIPSVMWNDVGGLEDVKREILQTVTMPLKHPELTAGGLGRSGILLYGPPGTGKTLLAKAVATECNLNFLSVKGPELLNMYVGQSEANVREVFERARGASPCIIFFDELDALAPNRGRSGDSGGVMDRVVSQLSSEMDGLQKSALLFVIGATNRPDLIDPALLRPGRFDKLLYVGAYEDSESKFSVLSALTRKFKLNPDVNLRELSCKLPLEVTGADMYAVCSGAWLQAVRRIIILNQKGSEKLGTDVEVKQEDFNEAVSKMTPSVSEDDMEYFRGLQKQMSAVKGPSRS